MTVGENLIDYLYVVSTSTVDLNTSKCLFNSVVSTPRAKFMVAVVKDFYLNTSMPRYEYMRVPIAWIPDKIIQEYNLWEIVDDEGYIYMEIRKGMYGLP